MPYFSFDGFPADGFHAPDEAAVVDGVGLMPPGDIKHISDQAAAALTTAPLFTEHEEADYDAQEADRAAPRALEIEEEQAASEPETEQDSAPHDDPERLATDPATPSIETSTPILATPTIGVKTDA